ncbi:MAG: SDR family oxidoreductase, partial [Pseudomonadota bacterium]
MADIALVTGAGSGIGRHTALALAKAGYQVALCGRRQVALTETKALADDNAVIADFPCDVTDEAAVDQLFSDIEKTFGRLDVLFNNAGINLPMTPVGDVTPDQWRAIIDVNLTGSFLCARAAFNLMRRQSPQGGRIINNGS